MSPASKVRQLFGYKSCAVSPLQPQEPPPPPTGHMHPGLEGCAGAGVAMAELLVSSGSALTLPVCGFWQVLAAARGKLRREEGSWREDAVGQGAPCHGEAEQSSGVAAHTLGVKQPVGPPGEALGTARGQGDSLRALERRAETRAVPELAWTRLQAQRPSAMCCPHTRPAGLHVFCW